MKKNNLKFLPKFFYMFLGFLLVVFLLLNIFFSQNISSLFTGLVNNQKQAVVSYLKKIKLLPQFGNELKYYKQTFGKEIEDEVFKDKREREKKIIELEGVLKKNDQARDVLYGLYLLYKEDGNNIKAEEYLKRAKKIDPTL